MFSHIFWIAVVVAASVQLAVQAAPFQVDYSADVLPSANAPYGFYQVNTMTASGGVLAIPGSTSTGHWFGNDRDRRNVPSNWSLGTSTQGHYVNALLRFSPGAEDFNIYIYDDAFQIGMNFNADGFSYDSASGGGGVSRDLTADFVRFEMMLKDGVVSYAVDGQAVYRGPASSANYGFSILVVGDGSGSTPTGAGTMYLDALTYIREPDFELIPGPAGAMGAMMGLGLLGLGRRR